MGYIYENQEKLASLILPLDLQSQFINQHVKASIIQRNAPTNVWSWEFNIVQRACPRVLFGGWLTKNWGYLLNHKSRS
jgi:hypothetical protein